jgi:hypothetical protein
MPTTICLDHRQHTIKLCNAEMGELFGQASQKPHLSQGDRWGTRKTFSLAEAARTV